MMNTLKIYSVIIAFAAMTIACSKDDAPTAPAFTEQNTYQLMLDKQNFNSITPSFGATELEAGIMFKPLAKGKITKFIVKLPAANANLAVNVWDITNGNLIKTEVVNVDVASTEKTFAITPIALEKDVQYAITMRTYDTYESKRVGTDPLPFPFNCGSIQVTGFALSQAHQFPGAFGNTYYGNVGFKFIQTP